MRTTRFVLLLGCVAFGLWLVRPTSALPFDPGAIAGSYLMEEINMPPHTEDDGARVLLTLTFDGCAVLVDSDDFFGFSGGGDFQSAAMAVWTRASRTQTHIRGISFGYDLTGVPQSFIRTSATLEFADGYLDHGQAKVLTEFFHFTQDPLDPDAVPFDKHSETYSFRSITVD
ncbi:MAG: hypothetical protein HKO59_01135 [Phycisphaerales bacterium]|nr:hypothetical protein [Phycisphaerae bacterium]NNF41633.1 hypothetical protein [Phycisphaerales bacterium]NNM24583.1 hypothetical protein [Phycisphaerales bacterium]